MVNGVGKIFWLALCALLVAGCTEEPEPAEGTPMQTEESGEDD